MMKNTTEQLRQQNRKRLDMTDRGERRHRKGESFADSKRGKIQNNLKQNTVRKLILSMICNYCVFIFTNITLRFPNYTDHFQMC